MAVFTHDIDVWDRLCTVSRAPCTKETLPDFHEWCRVTRHPLLFRGLTGCQRTPWEWGVTTRQPAEYSWMLGNSTLLTKIGLSLLCTGSSTQNTTCPNILQRPHRVHVRVKMATWALASILTKYIPTNYITWFKS